MSKTRPEGARGCSSSSPRLADPPVLPALLQGGILIMGPLADALCVAQVAWLSWSCWRKVVEMKQSAASYIGQNTSSSCRVPSWHQVEQDPHIGNSARKSFDKLSQLGPFGMVKNLTFLTWKVSRSFHGNHGNGTLLSRQYTHGQVCQKKEEIKCEAPDQAQNRAINVGKWLSGLNHTIPLQYVFLSCT